MIQYTSRLSASHVVSEIKPNMHPSNLEVLPFNVNGEENVIATVHLRVKPVV